VTFYDKDGSGLRYTLLIQRNFSAWTHFAAMLRRCCPGSDVRCGTRSYEHRNQLQLYDSRVAC